MLRRSILLTTLAMLAAAAAHGSDPASSRLTLGGTVEVERDGGFMIGGDFAYRTSGGTRWRADASRSDLRSDNLQTLTTTRVGAGVRHPFGEAGPIVELDVDWWQDPDTVTARELGTGIEFGPRSLQVGVRAGWRRAEFEPFTLGGVAALPSGRLLPVSGSARCTLDNLSYGLDLTRDTERYVVYLHGRTYDYDPTECSFSSRGLDGLARSSSAQFRAIASAQTSQLARTAASRSSAQTSFLDYSVGGGFGWRRGADEYGVDLAHDREQFAGVESNALTLLWLRAFESGLDLMLYAGATDSDAFGTLPFVGVSVSRTF